MAAELWEVETESGERAWIGLSDAAERYGVSGRTVRRWCRAGRLERREDSGQVYVRPSSARHDRTSGRPAQGADTSGTEIAIVFEARLSRLREDYDRRVEALHRELADVRVSASTELAEAHAATELATRDAEQAKRGATYLAAQLDQERQRRATAEAQARDRERAAVLASQTRWWQRRRRRELLLEAAGLATKSEAE